MKCYKCKCDPNPYSLYRVNKKGIEGIFCCYLCVKKYYPTKFREIDKKIHKDLDKTLIDFANILLEEERRKLEKERRKLEKERRKLIKSKK